MDGWLCKLASLMIYTTVLNLKKTCLVFCKVWSHITQITQIIQITQSLKCTTSWSQAVPHSHYDDR